MRNTDQYDDLPVVETPEDVAVLYSWANLHGAKYRDFSASRREYRAQLRRRAAEQARESELQAKDEAELAAEHAAAQAEALAREADRAAELQREQEDTDAEFARLEALRQAEEAARLATAERIEAARRSEAAALADAAARREDREIAEAAASAQRQSARYAESEQRRRQLEAAVPPSPIPGQISDPYTPLPQQAALLNLPSSGPAPMPDFSLEPARTTTSRRDRQPALALPITPYPQEGHTPMSDWNYPPHASEDDPPPSPPASSRPRGYRPDDASGVRRIVRSPEFEASSERPASPPTRLPAHPSGPSPTVPRLERPRPAPASSEASRASRPDPLSRPETVLRSEHSYRAQPGLSPRHGVPPVEDRYLSAASRPRALAQDHLPGRAKVAAEAYPGYQAESAPERPRPPLPLAHGGVVSPFSQQPLPSAHASPQREAYLTRSRQSEMRQATPAREPDEVRPSAAENTYSREARSSRPAPVSSTQPPPPAAPAWIYEASDTTPRERPQAVSGDTLQQSRERVASRWYALKGVFDQPGTTLPEQPPTRQMETRTPVLAVFSLAGGVGKTSLVATLGRTLSSLGEKVLLTDTTAHGLLPFYFGASELRQGTVRTFSPPSGSTDAPIYLVSYDANSHRHDEEAEEAFAEEITTSSRGTHRVLLDLTSASAWVIRRLAHVNPIILVPVAPDMNSVISLQTVEKLFTGVSNAEGRPPQVFFLLNHFDASLPLHLDVREVLHRQLGDRLLPFAIRRAPVVSEALAEGMTVVDYSPEAPVADDYLHVANWLRTQVAPATAGFRNVRWSER